MWHASWSAPYLKATGLARWSTSLRTRIRTRESFLKQFFFAEHEVILGSYSECECQIFWGDRLVENRKILLH